MKFRALLITLILAALVVLPTGPVQADTLVLKDGRRIQGKFLGRTAYGVVFEVDGEQQTFGNENVESIKVGSTAPAASAPAQPQPQAPAPAYPAQPYKAPQSRVTVQAGTVLRVRNTTPLVSSQSKAGDPVITELVSPVMVGNREALPQGTQITGRVVEAVEAKRAAGLAKLVIQLTEVEYSGRRTAIQTDPYQVTGQRSGTGRNVALGAATGGIIDGSQGAQTGAAVGAVVSATEPGTQVAIPAGSVIEFTVTMAFSP